MQAARAQQPVGEDMAPVGIGTELDLIHRQKIRADLQRHRLDGADPVLRPLGHDALFAGDQCHHRRPARRDDTIIDLARKQPQRQADHPCPMRQHPLDGIMRLARIRRPEDRDDPRLLAHLLPLRLKFLPGGLRLEPLDRIQYRRLVRMYSGRHLIGGQCILRLVNALKDHPQPGQRRKVLRVQRQRLPKIADRGAVKPGVEIGLGPRIIGFREFRGMID